MQAELGLGVRSSYDHGIIFIKDDKKSGESGCTEYVCLKVTHRNACRRPRAVCRPAM